MSADPADPILSAPGNPEVVNRSSTPGMEKWLPKYAKDTDRPYEGDPWERQPKETAKSYSAFVVYRDMKPDERSVGKAYLVYRESIGTPTTNTTPGYKWSMQHRWEERAAAYDAYLAKKLRNRLERRRLETAEKHADQLEDALEVFTAPAIEFANRMRRSLAEDGYTFVTTMSDEDLLKLVKTMTGEVPGLQKAQRDALTTGAETPLPSAAKVKAKGQLLRQIVENKDMRGLVERMQFEVEETTADDTDDE